MSDDTTHEDQEDQEPQETQETIESLTEAVQGLFDITIGHAHLISSIIRALDEAGIDIPGIYSQTPSTH